MGGEYPVLEPVRKGAADAIYKARHRDLDRIVGLRLLPNQLNQRPELAKRYRLDVEAAARLVHPHIVTPLDTVTSGEEHFLVMQFVDGDRLSALLERDGPLPPALAVDCVLQAARGLSYAHLQGIIHGDVRPENLILDGGGTVRLLEVGLGRCESATSDQRTDIEQLGHTLRRLLTGQWLDAVESKATTGQEPTPLNLCRECPDAPRELNTLFQRMVNARRANRFETMTEVVKAFEALSRAHGWYVHAAKGLVGEPNLPEAFRAWRDAQQKKSRIQPDAVVQHAAARDEKLPRRPTATGPLKLGLIGVAVAAVLAAGIIAGLIF